MRDLVDRIKFMSILQDFGICLFSELLRKVVMAFTYLSWLITLFSQQYQPICSHINILSLYIKAETQALTDHEISGTNEQIAMNLGALLPRLTGLTKKRF